MKPSQISIRTMTEYYLNDFIRCPYKFYYQYIEKKQRQSDWRQVVQHVVNQVVYTYYQLPAEYRHAAKVLELTGQYWDKVSPQMFESVLQYYMVSARIMDYLMQNLTAESSVAEPLFLYEKFKTHIQELKTDLSLTFDVAEWSQSSFVVKKYLVEANAEMLRLYYHLTIVFSKKVFERYPDRIEIITLMDGKKHVFYPTEEHFENGLNYLQLMKHLLENPSSYTDVFNENECPSCPYKSLCEQGEKNINVKKYLS